MRIRPDTFRGRRIGGVFNDLLVSSSLEPDHESDLTLDASPDTQCEIQVRL